MSRHWLIFPGERAFSALLLTSALAACSTSEGPRVEAPSSVVSVSPAAPSPPPPSPAPSPASGAGKDRYSLDDLRALSQQRGWTELVEHLADIPPSQRGAEWQALAEQAAVQLLATLARDREPLAAVAAADDLTKRYPTITSSETFMKKRAEVGLRGFEVCYAQSYTGADCTERFLGFVQADPTNYDLALLAGRLVIRKQFPYVAVPFFKRAVIGNKDPGKACNDDELKRSVRAALEGLLAEDPRVADAKQIQAACRGVK